MLNYLKYSIIIFLSYSYCFAHDIEDHPDMYILYEKSDFALYSYKPIYIGYISKNSNEDNEGGLKFQLSFKYELINDTNWFFGYTQKSFWDIHRKSEPIRESNYNPELIKIVDMHESTSFFAIGSLKYINLGIYSHESTGEKEVGESFEWDFSYIEPAFIIDDFAIKPKVWHKWAALANEDILDYYGHGEVEISWFQNKYLEHNLTYRIGKSSDYYGLLYNLNLTFGTKSNIKLFFQKWIGYGESLKNYNKKTSSIIVGLSLVK